MDILWVEQEFKRIEGLLLDQSNWRDMELTRNWARTFPVGSGVYALFENGTPVYFGETGSLRARVMDMLNSRHHTVRRALGELRFKNVPGYRPATSSIKYPEHIEQMVQETMLRLKICTTVVAFGRKEFEEYAGAKYRSELNRSSKRGGSNT